jgi:hypothetical protein
LAGKLLLACAGVYWLNRLLMVLFPLPPKDQYVLRSSSLPHDSGFSFFLLGIAMLAAFLISTAMIGITIWDQRRRCRTCLRRLRMPVSLGSRSNMLMIGRPQTAWICPYGHGTLKRDDVQFDVQIAAFANADWEPHGDNIWEELESYREK